VRGGKVPSNPFIDWREGRGWRKGRRRERREGVEMQPCVRRCSDFVRVTEEADREEEGGKEKEEEEEQARCFVSFECMCVHVCEGRKEEGHVR